MTQLNPVFPEKGGLLGGKNGIITCFEKDKSAITNTANQYTPNIYYLNMILSRLNFMVLFIHTHMRKRNYQMMILITYQR